MNNDEIFDEMFSNYLKIIDKKKYFLDNYTFYKNEIKIFLSASDLNENIFGIFLVEELDDIRKNDFLEPLLDIFLYNLGISHRVSRIFFSLDKKILTNDLKEIICKKKNILDYLEVSMILNFYKNIDKSTALFFCNFFQELNDRDINETIDDFLISLNE